MQWTDLLTALALALALEGALPFLSPAMSRAAARKWAALGDGKLRALGGTVMLAGVGLLYLVR